MRVLYAPRNISGQASEYVAAVRPFGIDGEVWSYGETAYDFPADRVVDRERLLTDPRARWELFDEAVRTFDVFHLIYGRSLLDPIGHVLPDLWDLPLLKSLGKRVVMHFRGSDVRRPSVHASQVADSYLRDTVVDEDRIEARIAICRRYCDALLVSTPGLLDEVPDATWLPHVIDVDAWRTARGAEPDVPVVAHIPSSRGTKGSDVIDTAMRRLDADGSVVYRPLASLSRGELRAAVAASDILIDSLVIGDHGLISVEAMAAGAIAVAHVHPDNRARAGGSPVVEATVADLEQVIGGLARDPQRRAALRAAGLAYVRERHDRPVVGQMLHELYRQPATSVDRSYPMWPRSETRARVSALEDEVDRLQADVDPLLRGLGSLRSSLPAHALDRLVQRVGELEGALAEYEPDHPLVSVSGHRRSPRNPDTFRDLLKRNPAAHRLARRTALTVRGWTKGRGR